jgi:hypothetical protein
MPDIFYPVFEPDQVLTNSQLNILRSYFDDQNRLTRNTLVGTGIGCGLDLILNNSNNSINTVIVTKGHGITSAGYLITWDTDTEYTSYKTYNDPITAKDPNELQKMKYRFGINLDNPPVPDLFELTNDASGVLLTPAFLSNKVAVLFLEISDVSDMLCTDEDCDARGHKRKFRVVPLLINKDFIAKMQTPPCSCSLPQISTKRISETLDCQFQNMNSSPSINGYYKPFISKACDNYGTAVKSLIDSGIFERLFRNSTDKNDVISGLTGINSVYINSLLDKGVPVQYCYDLLKDIITAYDELAEIICKIKECNINTDFPRHLMLSLVITSENPVTRLSYRNYFMPSAILQNYYQNILKAEIYVRRLYSLCVNFNFNAAYPNVKITPSKFGSAPLGEKAIPYYYNINNTYNISDYWNPDYLICGKKSDLKTIADINGETENSYISYDMEKYPFWRIEGYWGKNIQTVTSQILTQKKKFNLPFDLLSLKLNANSKGVNINLDCGFSDVLTDLINLWGEIKCTLISLQGYLSPQKTDGKEYLYGSERGKYLKKTADSDKIVEMVNALDMKNSSTVLDFTGDDKQKTILDIFSSLNRYVVQSFGEYYEPYRNDNADDLYKTGYQKIMYAGKNVNIILDYLQRIRCLLYRYIILSRIIKFRHDYYDSQLLLSSFGCKHDGLEHFGGVERGGTFVIVYDEKGNAVADFSLPYTICCENPPLVPFESLKDIFALPDFLITSKDTKVIKEYDHKAYGAAKYETVMEKEPAHGAVEIAQNKEGNVTRSSTVSYTPAANYAGEDSFILRVKDIDNKTSVTFPVSVFVAGAAAEDKGILAESSRTAEEAVTALTASKLKVNDISPDMRSDYSGSFDNAFTSLDELRKDMNNPSGAVKYFTDPEGNQLTDKLGEVSANLADKITKMSEVNPTANAKVIDSYSYAYNALLKTSLTIIANNKDDVKADSRLSGFMTKVGEQVKNITPYNKNVTLVVSNVNINPQTKPGFKVLTDKLIARQTTPLK